MSDADYRQLLKDVQDVGLPVPSTICVAFGLHDFNSSILRFHRDRVKRHIDLAKDLKAPVMVLALGEYIWEHQVIPPHQQWKTAVESLREIGDHAAAKGVKIAIEIEPFKMSIINNINKLVKFLEDIDHPAVHANIDCSHLWLMGIEPDEISKLSGRILHCHFSDCNGEIHGDLPPGRGNTPLGRYLSGLNDAGFKGVVSLELEYAPQPDKIVEWVTEAYTNTADMMRELGVLEETVPAR
jgi:sugar phosphate isomerase/epimerase